MVKSANNLVKNKSSKNLSFLWLEITEKCNLECSHCYADSNPRKEILGRMDSKDWISIIEQSANLGCEEIQFIGGEPTLHPDLTHFIKFASSLNYKFIEVFTNSTYIPDKLLKTFIKYNVNVATSFYSDDSQTHDRITKRLNSFYRTVNGLKCLVHAQIPVRVGIIEMQENKNHSQSAKRYLENIGITDIAVDFQRSVGRGNRGIENPNPIEELCGECWKGKLCVTSSGKVFPCVFSRFAELGHVSEGIENIIGSKRMSSFHSSIKRTRENIELTVCNPDQCGPTSSSCSPNSFCSPSNRCSPDTQKCQPAKPCQPSKPNSPNYSKKRIH